MYPVNPQLYRQMYKLGENDPVPSIEIWPNFYQIHEEHAKDDETCFVKTAVQFFTRKIGLEEYFDRLIGHLGVHAEQHTFDRVETTNFDHFLRMDLICGAVKSLMLNPSFHRLQEPGERSTVPVTKPKTLNA